MSRYGYRLVDAVDLDIGATEYIGGEQVMNRFNIIDTVGREYLTENLEKGEFSYPKAFKEKGLELVKSCGVV